MYTGYLKTVHLGLKIGTMKGHMGELGGDLMTESTVSLIIPEDDMDRSLEAAGEIGNNKGSVKVTCVNQMTTVGFSNLRQSLVEMIQTVMRVGYESQSSLRQSLSALKPLSNRLLQVQISGPTATTTTFF